MSVIWWYKRLRDFEAHLEYIQRIMHKVYCYYLNTELDQHGPSRGLNSSMLMALHERNDVLIYRQFDCIFNSILMNSGWMSNKYFLKSPSRFQLVSFGNGENQFLNKLGSS